LQWVACALLTWWTLRAWRAEDRGFTTETAETTEEDRDREKN